jgi:hypothetical protein
MKNRAKCKKCNSIIESFHSHDYVSCACGEISVDGGQDYFKCSAVEFTNFLRIDDEGNEIVVTVKEKEDNQEPAEYPTKLSKKDLIKMLDDMVVNIENLPQEAMLSPINNYDFCSLLILLSSIFKEET